MPETLQPLPPWEDVADNYQREFPNVATNALRNLYQQSSARRMAEIRFPSEGAEYLYHRSVPFGSAYFNAQEARRYADSRQRISEENAGEGDYHVVARYERLHNLRTQNDSGFLGGAGSALASIPAIAGEAYAGGRVLGALGLAGGSAPSAFSAPFGGVGFSGQQALRNLPGQIARNAVTTAAMPSMWAPQWIEGNQQNGRDPLDPRGLPSAFTMGFMNTAVLGSLGQFGNSITTTGVRGAAARLLTRTATGMLEQQGVDLMASAVSEVLPEAYRLQTGYGLLGHLATKGADKDFWKHAFTQAVTFGAFSVMHEIQTPHQVAQEMRQTLNQAHESGASAPEAAQALVEQMRNAVDPMAEGLSGNQPVDRSGPGQLSPGVAEVPVKPPEQFAPRAPGSEVPIGAEQPSLTTTVEPPRTGQEATGGQIATEAAPEGRTGQNLGVPEPPAPVVQPAVESRLPLLEDRVRRHGGNPDGIRSQVERIGLSVEGQGPEAGQARVDAVAQKYSSESATADYARAYAERIFKPTAEQAEPIAPGTQYEHPLEQRYRNIQEARRRGQVPEDTITPEDVHQVMIEEGVAEKMAERARKYLSGTTLEQIGASEGVTREAVRTSLDRIGAKIRLKESFFEAVHKDAKASAVAEMVALGRTQKGVTINELRADPANTRAASERAGRLQESIDSHDALTSRLMEGDWLPPNAGEIYAKILKEAESGKLTKKRSAFWERAIEEARSSGGPIVTPPAESVAQVPERGPEATQGPEAGAGGPIAQGGTRPPGAGEPVIPAAAGIAADPRAEPMPSTAMREQGGTMGGGPLVGIETKSTALANEKIKQERIEGGLAEIEKQIPQSDKEIWNRARETARASPEAGYLLAKEVIESKGKRALNSEESMLILHSRIAIRNQLDATIKKAFGGEAAGMSDMAYARLQREVADLWDRRDVLDNAARTTGSETGRVLRLRRVLANYDYSLSEMLFGAQKAKGEKLTKEESTKITELQKKIQELNEKLEHMEKEQPTKVGERIPEERAKASFEFNEHVKEWKKLQADFEFSKQSGIKKSWHWLTEALNLQRSLWLGADFPPLLRQGLFFTLGHPLKAIKALRESATAFKSKEAAHGLELDLQNHPDYENARAAGLQFSNPDGPLSSHEEAFRSSLISKVPVFSGLERWHSAFMNTVRLQYFESMKRTLTKDGTGTPAEQKIIADAANIFTGRGNMYGAESAVGALSMVFTSPRYVASRFEALLGTPLWSGNMATRKAIAKEYARSALGLTALLGAAYLANKAGLDMDTELDWRSSDFGKIRVGNTRLDPYGGVQQALVFLARMGTGKTKTLTGQVRNIRNSEGEPLRFGQDDAADTAFRFFRGKMAPVPGALLDVSAGRNMVGEPVTPARGAVRLITPLSVSDIYEAFGDLGIPRGAAVSIWALFGGGAQSYSRLSRR